MTSFTSLSLDTCYNITDAGLKILEHMTSLASLSLARCYNITDCGAQDS